MIEIHREKNRFLCGKATFTDDINPPGFIHCLTVRSRIPNGEIKSISAQILPQDYFLFNYKMIPGVNRIKFPDCEIPCLAEKDVSYAGEPVVLLAGPEKRMLEELESKIDIRYSLRQPVYSTDDPLSDKKLEYRYSRGNASKALAQADAAVLEKTYNIGCQDHVACETQSVLARWDDQSNLMTVFVSSIHPFHVRSSVASVLGIQEKSVRVIVPDTSDSLSGKLYFPSLIASQAALVSFLTKRPCKLVFSRYEELLYSWKRPPARISLLTASDAKGKLLALKAEITLDCGAYRINPRIVAERMIAAMLSMYECESVEIKATSATTNKVPSGPFCGLGEPQAAFALELHATYLAKNTANDPYQWRARNALPALKSRARGTGDSEPGPAVLEEVIKKSDFVRKHAAYEALAKRAGPGASSNLMLRGIGLAFSTHGNGMPGFSEEEDTNHFIRLMLEKNKTLRIVTSFVDSNLFKETFFGSIASRILGISEKNVFFEHADTATSPFSGPQMCSRTVSVLGKAIEHSCRVLAQKAAKGAPAAEVTRKILVQSRPRIDSSSFDGEVYPSYAAEGTVVEVEINPTTLQVLCRGIWIVIDAGLVISPELARLSVEQAAILNLGYAATEQLSFEIGRIEQRSLSEYCIPGIKDYPAIEVFFLEGEKGKRPHTPHGLGDQAVTCVAPAYVAAIVQALGREYTSIPLYAEIMDSREIEKNENQLHA